MKKENKQQKKKDEWAGFKKYYVNGMEVVDLTSVDRLKWHTTEYYDSITRQMVYGDYRNPNRM